MEKIKYKNRKNAQKIEDLKYNLKDVREMNHALKESRAMQAQTIN